MTAHACHIDRSKETGSLVVCTCGLVLGPFIDHGRAVTEARAHRAIHAHEDAMRRQRERRRGA